MSIDNSTVKSPSVTLTRWTPLHSTILLMYSEGKGKKEIGDELKLTEKAIEKIIKSQMFQEKFKQVGDRVVQTVVAQRSEVQDGVAVQEARRVLTEASITAALIMVQMSRDPNCKSKIQFEACKDILDRAGLKPMIITETRERVYSPEEIQGAKKVLEETQAIVARLSNSSSPFVLSDIGRGSLAGSDTDKTQSGSQPPNSAG